MIGKISYSYLLPSTPRVKYNLRRPCVLEDRGGEGRQGKSLFVESA